MIMAVMITAKTNPPTLTETAITVRETVSSESLVLIPSVDGAAK